MKNMLILTLLFLMTACIPDKFKEKMNEGMSNAQQMMAVGNLKAPSQIELHKLRNGRYPNSLSELRFLSAMDSSMIRSIDYTRLDSVYELNLKPEFFALQGEGIRQIELKYPAEFWAGLGCVKSNLK